MDINWNYDCTSPSSALRRLELMRRFQKASEGFGYADISAVFACGLVSAVLQVTKTKDHAQREFDEICARMRDIIKTNYDEITDDQH
jgi:formiminotetrahydrofolate cyclodeaminase